MNLLIKTSNNLYIYWNIGSILGMMMVMQIFIGLMLSMNYFSNSFNMFINSFNIYYNLNYGWMMRIFHNNLTSILFILMFIHISRTMIYMNYINKKMWNMGLLMLLLMMMISYLGYSLIWSQMSYWASMVITNFIAIIPIIGNKILLLIWGNRFINNILLNRFFSIHYLFAFSMIILSMIHLIILHKNKSTNPLNINNNIDQMNLNPLLMIKDLIMFIILTYSILMINMLIPIKLNNADNFNSMMIFKTPNHIEPEWYFLFFYSILRSNENKLNGLILMLLTILIWFMIPMFNKLKFMNNNFFIFNKFLLFNLLMILIMITFIGTKTSKEPYINYIKIFIIIYFFLFLLMILSTKLINLMLLMKFN